MEQGGIDRLAGVGSLGADAEAEDSGGQSRPVGAVPDGCQGLVWDQLERAADKYAKDPQTGGPNYGVIVSPGRPKGTVDNISTILEMDTRWAGRIRYNQFRDLVEVDGVGLGDRAEIGLVRWLDRVYMLPASPKLVHDGVIGASLSSEYHPLREYLDRVAMTWDGVDRAADWLPDYLGTGATPLIRSIGAKFLISMVARAYAELPDGVKCDTTLILIGKQGARKSTALATLAGRDWFSDSAVDLRNPKDAMGQLRGVWLYEFAELDSIRPREVTSVKAFLSAQVDRYRPAYGRNTEQHARSVVFCGTTNAESGAFLTDPTGSRRFWPVEVGEIDLEGLEAVRDQLWGEAVAMYRAGATWWVEDDQADELADYSERFQQFDAWADVIAKWATQPPIRREATPDEILTDALEIPTGQQTKGHQMRIAAAMASLGWSRHRPRRGGRRVTVWAAPDHYPQATE